MPKKNGKMRQAQKKAQRPEPSAAPRKEVTASTSTAPAEATPQTQPRPKQTHSGPPALEPWMKSTVVLRLKEVDGRVPDMTSDVFGKKMLLEQGFSKAETLSIQNFVRGIFFVTFISLQVCRRYWELVTAAGPDSPFQKFRCNSPIQREERRVTVMMRNPHVPAADITTYLKRFCEVLKGPTRILDANGFWTGKWSVICKLRRDPSKTGGLQHLKQCFSLGNSPGLLSYEDVPHTCRKCGMLGHQGKDCRVPACRFCQVTGHEAKDCPRTKTCNLCGSADHMYKDCPRRDKSYAGRVAQGARQPVQGPANPTPSRTAQKTAAKGGKTPTPPHTQTQPPPSLRPQTPPLPPCTQPPPPTTQPPPPPPNPEPLPSTSHQEAPPPPLIPLTSVEEFPPLVTQAETVTKGKRKQQEDSTPEEETVKKKAVDPIPSGESGESKEDLNLLEVLDTLIEGIRGGKSDTVDLIEDILTGPLLGSPGMEEDPPDETGKEGISSLLH